MLKPRDDAAAHHARGGLAEVDAMRLVARDCDMSDTLTLSAAISCRSRSRAVNDGAMPFVGDDSVFCDRDRNAAGSMTALGDNGPEGHGASSAPSRVAATKSATPRPGVGTTL
jgi:hypothetical protein